MQNKLKIDLKRLANSELAGNLARHFNEYESRVREAVRGLDLKSREAREKSRLRLDGFVVQLKKTRGELEKKVVSAANHQGQRLNRHLGDFVNYLKSISRNEKMAKSEPVTRKASKAGSSTTKPKGAPRKKKSAARVGASGAAAASHAS